DGEFRFPGSRSGAILRYQSREHIFPSLNDCLPIEASNVLTPPQTHCLSFCTVRKQEIQTRKKFIVFSDQKSCDAVHNGFRLIVLARNDWQTARCGFGNYLRRAFPSRRKEKNIRSTIFLAHILNSQQPFHLNIG